MQLMLIRHACNDWVDKKLAGWTPGVHLNEVGRNEAEALAHRLDGYRIDAIYSSPLERAMETAAYIAEPRALTIRELPEIGEIRYGSWTGRTLDELREEPLWATAMHVPSAVRFPEGESIVEAQYRVVAAIEALKVDHQDGVVAAVAHGDVVKLAVSHYVGLPIDLFQRIIVSTASLTVLRLTPHGPRLQLLNSTDSIPPPPEAKKQGGHEQRGDT